jgi:hypothetical protein
MPSGSSRRSASGRRGSTRRPCRCRHAAAPGTTAFRTGKSRRAAPPGSGPQSHRLIRGSRGSAPPRSKLEPRRDARRAGFARTSTRCRDQADFGGTKYRPPPKNVACDPTSRITALGAHMRGNSPSHCTDSFSFYARSLHSSFQLLRTLTHVIASIELPEFLHRLSGSRRRSDVMNRTACKNLTARKMNSTA